MKRLRCLLPCATILFCLSTPTPVLARQPAMTWGEEIICIEHGDGRQTRLQCTEGGGRCSCLKSGNRIIGPDGKETDREMHDLMGCSEYREPFFLEQLEASGCRVQEAIAEAPDGYARDENGRIFQVSFDLANRLYLGGRWAPFFPGSGGEVLDRGGIDFGIRVDDLSYSGRKRHRHRVLEGAVSFMPVDFEILLWGYDLGTRREEPAVWLTTFIGPPTRFDLDLDLGWGFRLLTARYHPMGSKAYTELENLSLYLSWELYHNRPMDSFVRFAIGPACSELLSRLASESSRFAIYPVATLDSELVLDRRGLHRLALALSASPRWYLDEADALYSTARGSLSYEFVFLAINDQPLSVFLDGSAKYRDDIPDAPDNWLFEAVAGLRFNFFAPTRELN
jgi:hypothetical protein